MCEYCNIGDINPTAALSALQIYKAMDGVLQRANVLKEFQAIYNNNQKAAEQAVTRIARHEPQNTLPARRVVRELELLLHCHGNGNGMLDG